MPPAPDSLSRPPAPGGKTPPDSAAARGGQDSTRTPAAARPSAPDTAASRIDVVPGLPEDSSLEAAQVLEEAAAHRSGGRLATKPPGRFDAPRWVMFRSALLPGWGQFHNRAWIKGLAIAGGEIALISGIVSDNRDLDRLSREADEAAAAGNTDAYEAAVNAYNQTLAQTTSNKWWLGGLLAYALADAYVDAHFAHFNVEFDTGRGKGSKKTTSRLRLGWSF